MITTDDFFVRLIQLPPRVRGVTVPNDDGTFSIYINSSLDYFMQRDAYDHEVRHVVLNHFYEERPIEDIESEAKGYSLAEVVLNTPTATQRTNKAEVVITDKNQNDQKTIPCYNSLRDLEKYLRSINALGTPIEDLGEQLW